MKRHTFIAGLGGLTKSMIAAAACVVTAAYAQSTATRLGCDLQLIEPSDKATSPKALQLTISLGKVGVDFGSGNIAVKVESNNNIQLNCLHRPHGYRPQSEPELPPCTREVEALRRRIAGCPSAPWYVSLTIARTVRSWFASTIGGRS